MLPRKKAKSLLFSQVEIMVKLLSVFDFCPTPTECCFCRTDPVAKLRFSNLVSSPLAYAGCSYERGRFELVSKRFSGHCNEICEPATNVLGSELFMLQLIVI